MGKIYLEGLYEFLQLNVDKTFLVFCDIDFSSFLWYCGSCPTTNLIYNFCESYVVGHSNKSEWVYIRLFSSCFVVYRAHLHMQMLDYYNRPTQCVIYCRQSGQHGWYTFSILRISYRQFEEWLVLLSFITCVTRVSLKKFLHHGKGSTP